MSGRFNEKKNHMKDTGNFPLILFIIVPRRTSPNTEKDGHSKRTNYCEFWMHLSKRHWCSSALSIGAGTLQYCRYYVRSIGVQHWTEKGRKELINSSKLIKYFVSALIRWANIQFLLNLKKIKVNLKLLSSVVKGLFGLYTLHRRNLRKWRFHFKNASMF